MKNKNNRVCEKTERVSPTNNNNKNTDVRQKNLQK